MMFKKKPSSWEAKQRHDNRNLLCWKNTIRSQTQSLQLVRVDERGDGWLPVNQFFRFEPECNFPLSGINGIRSMNNVRADTLTKVCADGSWKASGGVSLTEDHAAKFDSLQERKDRKRWGKKQLRSTHLGDQASPCTPRRPWAQQVRKTCTWLASGRRVSMRGQHSARSGASRRHAWTSWRLIWNHAAQNVWWLPRQVHAGHHRVWPL